MILANEQDSINCLKELFCKIEERKEILSNNHFFFQTNTQDFVALSGRDRDSLIESF
jgi:hypothetical protein